MLGPRLFEAWAGNQDWELQAHLRLFPGTELSHVLKIWMWVPIGDAQNELTKAF